MELNSVQSDVHRLLEQMYDAIDKPVIDRDNIRELTDEIATLTMVNANPCLPAGFVELRLKGFSPKQIAIFNFLLRYKGKCVSRPSIMHAIWGDESEVTSKNLEVQVCHLRKSLMRTKAPYRIEALYGSGYSIMDWPKKEFNNAA